MSANFYELLKYATTGQASPDMTYYDRMRASTLMGGVVQTLTGIPPLTFKSDGTPLISWSMKGNGSQSGTPTPDNPVMPEFVGVRTWNLWDKGVPLYSYTKDYKKYNADNSIKLKAGTYTISSDGRVPTIQAFDDNNDHIVPISDAISYGVQYYIQWDNYAIGPMSDAVRNATITLLRDCTLTFAVIANIGTYIMLNLGSTALPYEPYGWAEYITCAGQTVPVYLGQTQTVRRVRKYEFTGTEALQTSGSGNARFFYMTIADARSLATIISDRYVNANIQSTTEEIGVAMSGNSQFRIRPDTTSTVEEYKQYLASEYAAGHPVTILYVLATSETAIVNEPLCKIGDYADELHSTDAAVTIPTVRGQNTLTVDTELQPSEMTITYKG